MTQRRRLCLILGMTALYLLLSFAWQDIYFADESSYLQAGVNFHPAVFVNNLPFAPLYSLWYRGLQVIVGEPTTRYFLSWALLVLATTLVPAVFNVECSILLAAVLLALPFFSVWPYVSLFACVPLLAFAALSLKKKFSLSAVSALACLSCFVVALSRPEFAYGVFLSAGACLVFALIERKKSSMVALVAAIALCGVMSYPLRHSSNSRSGLAFVQHFNLRAQQRHELPDTDPNTSLYAYRAFGIHVDNTMGEKPVSVVDFYRANKSLFLHHLLRNALDPRTLLLLALFAGGLLWAWSTPRGAAFRPSMVFLGLSSLPVFAAYIVVYPELHYLTIILPALLLVGLEAWNPMERLRWNAWWVVGASAFLMIAFVGAKCLKQRSFPRPKPNLAMIHCMRSLDISQPSAGATVLDPLAIPSVYFKLPKTVVAAYEMPAWSQYVQYLQANRPNWVLVPATLSQQYGVSASQVTDLLAKERYTPHACSAEATLSIFVADR